VDSVIEQQLDDLADHDRRGLAPVVALAIDELLHVESGHVLQQPVSEGGIDLAFKIAKDLLGLFAIADHLLAVVALSELTHGRIAAAAFSARLLLFSRRAAGDHLRGQLITLVARGLESEIGIPAQRHLAVDAILAIGYIHDFTPLGSTSSESPRPSVIR
jgi:hypothetical protein